MHNLPKTLRTAGKVWSTSKKYFGDRAVKVEIREVKND